MGASPSPELSTVRFGGGFSGGLGRVELQFLGGNLLVDFGPVDRRALGKARGLGDAPDEVRLLFEPERGGWVIEAAFTMQLEAGRAVEGFVGQAAQVPESWERITMYESSGPDRVAG